MKKNVTVLLILASLSGILRIEAQVGGSHKICMLDSEVEGLFDFKFISETQYHNYISNSSSEKKYMVRNSATEAELFEIFNLRSNIEWFDDFQSPNAFATPLISNREAVDGTIALGVNLCSSMDPITFKYIIYHEAAHLIDFKEDLDFSNKYAELWADFIAGVMLGIEITDQDIIMAELNSMNFYESNEYKELRVMQIGKLRNTLKQFYDRGDYNFNSPQHHGTPDERFDAVYLGFNLGAKEYEKLYYIENKSILKKYSKKEIQNILERNTDYFKVSYDKWGFKLHPFSRRLYEYFKTTIDNK